MPNADEKRNICQCNCGQLCRNRFAPGHNSKKIILEKTINICECGCGKLASFDKRFVLGHHPKGFKKAFLYTNSNSLVVKMRSSWEVLYAKYLDNLKIVWQYELKGFLLSNGHRYYPDFYLPELNAWHEIKGWLSPKAIMKINLFNSDFPHETLRILGKDYLKNLGLKI